MPRIFLSYARDNRPQAEAIAAALKTCGWDVWWDREILPGDTFHREIEGQLAAADCVVVLWSRNALGSMWVRDEAEEGRRRRILVPALLENVLPPLGFRGQQAATLMNWDGNPAHGDFQLLIRGIRRILERPGTEEGIVGPSDPRSVEPCAVSLTNGRLTVRARNSGPMEFVICGVNWSPASRDTRTSPADWRNAMVRRREFGRWYSIDVPLIKAMNANAVRLVIDPGLPGDPDVTVPGLDVLNELHRHNIKVIMTVDDSVNNVSRIEKAVAHYKEHPALLMWMLGSEWNINRYFGAAVSVFDAAVRTQQAATLIKSMDPNHPVACSYGDLDLGVPGVKLADTTRYVNDTCPSIDVWAVNIFRGGSFGTLFEQWRSITDKPLFIAEFGMDAVWAARTDSEDGTVDEDTQALWVLAMWRDIARHFSSDRPGVSLLGATVFEWNDQWWKVGLAGRQQTGGYRSPAVPDGLVSEEYFGVVDIDRKPRRVYGVLKEAFAAVRPRPFGAAK